MTVCIAARVVLYESSGSSDPVQVQKIVSICDRMLTFPDYAVDDILFKKRNVHPRWRAMYSSNDISPVTQIARQVEGSLGAKSGTFEEVVEAFRSAFESYGHELARNTILGKYGHDISSWRQKGFEEFGPDEFARINRLIERLYIGVQFLVYGFEPGGQPHIFLIFEDSSQGDIRLTVQPHDDDGFAIVGSGTTAALSALLSRPLPRIDLFQVAYRVCEAKLLAEKAPGVGKGTVLTILECAPPDFAVTEQYLSVDFNALRVVWENQGQARTPADALTLIQKAFADSVDWNTLTARLKKWVKLTGGSYKEEETG